MNSKTKAVCIQILYAAAGSLVFAIGVNRIIVPMNLYNGGFMGLSQMLRTLMYYVLPVQLHTKVDWAGIIYFVINIPLLYLGFRVIGSGFAKRTMFAVALQSVILVAIPVAKKPLFNDMLMACLVGGALAGFGSGLVLLGKSSGGGQEIIGICLSKRKMNMSVGKVNTLINLLVFGICLLAFDIQTTAYSFLYSIIVSVVTDKIHIQNIQMSVMIVTKKLGISKKILDELGRGVTNWDGEGAYTNKTAYILFVVISKYELSQLKRIVRTTDPDAFMIVTEGCSVDGNFEKRL